MSGPAAMGSRWLWNGFSSSDASIVMQLSRFAPAIDCLCSVGPTWCCWMKHWRRARQPERYVRLLWTPVQRLWSFWRSSQSMVSRRGARTSPLPASLKPITNQDCFSLEDRQPANVCTHYDRLTFCCFCDLDLDPMALIYELYLDILQMHLQPTNEVFMSNLWKVRRRTGQTDTQRYRHRQADATERITRRIHW